MIDVVIPTLNEHHTLSRTIRLAREVAGEPIRVIVADCGSHDGTVAIAQAEADIFTRDCRCRGDALQRGAAAGDGSTILFLHADTALPIGWARAVRRAVEASYVGGAFDFRFGDDPRCRLHRTPTLRGIEALNRIRFRIGRRFYGDQAIFVRRDVFDAIGGFPEVPLMEDVRFCERMRRHGPTAILQPPVRTSPRRFLSKGVIVTFSLDLLILAADSLGCSPEWMADRYRNWNCRGDVLYRKPKPAPDQDGGLLRPQS